MAEDEIRTSIVIDKEVYEWIKKNGMTLSGAVNNLRRVYEENQQLREQLVVMSNAFNDFRKTLAIMRDSLNQINAKVSEIKETLEKILQGGT